MITSTVFIALIGTLQWNSASSAAINYEPIKITVNEHFNAQPGQVFPELQEPAVVHQGANFYFKPQLNLPASYIPSHIEALISLIQQHHHTCAKDTSKVIIEKEKLLEILKPFMNPLSDIPKEALPEIVLEKENNLEIVKPIIINEEPKTVTSELQVNPESVVLLPSSSNDGIPSVVEGEVKKEDSIILEEPSGVIPTIPVLAVKPIPKPIINYVEPKPMTSEFLLIPEAPVLPPIVEEEMKKEEEIILEEPKGVFPTIPEIAVRPIIEPTINYIEPKSITSELGVIPEAPVLPQLSFNGIPPVDEMKKEESITLEASMGLLPEPTIIEVEPKPITLELADIPEALVSHPFLVKDIHIIEEEAKIEKPIAVDVEPPLIQELAAIPEAPVLPSFLLHDISSIEEEMKKGESIILKEPTGVFPTIPEIDVRPITDPIINYVETKPINSEREIIPEAPMLPPLSFNGIPPIVEEQVKEEKSIMLKESTGVLPEPTIIEVEPKSITSELVVIPVAPVLPPLSLNDIHVVEEEVNIEEPIVADVEPKPTIQKLEAIPEAPVLPSLSLHDMSSMIEEDVKKEESIIFEKPAGLFPTIPVLAVGPIPEPIINYVEPKPMTSEFLLIPEAPVLPPIVEEEMKKEEEIILEEPKGVFPTFPEIAVKPIIEPIINYFEPKPNTSELGIISEAPVLPPLSFNGVPPIVEEEVKKEESIILEASIGVLPELTIIEVDPKPNPLELVDIPEAPVLPPLLAKDIHIIEEEAKIEKPIAVGIEPKPVIQELATIPEAPVLPSLSLRDITSIMEEEVKKEQSIILEKPINVFPTIPEIDVRPITESIIDYVETKPITSELVIIPEAPVLPPLPFNAIPSIAEEEVKKEKSIIMEESAVVLPEPIKIEVDPKPITSKLLVIPEAPVLQPLSLNGILPVVEEEEKKKDQIILGKPTGVFPTVPEQDVRAIPEPVINYVEPKPITPKQVGMPEAPFLSSLSYNGIAPVVQEVKIEESIKVEESTGDFPSISDISAKPFPGPLEVESETVESFASEDNIFPIATEEVKIEVPILFEESIEVFPPIEKISSRLTHQESEITDSYVMKEVPQPNPESALTVKETLPPTIIPKPSNNLGVFSYAPFVSHLSNRAPKTKKLMIPKPASLERFLLKKRPFRLPVTPFPKLDLNAIKSSIRGNKKQFLYPTSYAHDVVEKRIAPNMEFKKLNVPKRVKIYIRSNVPKGPSY